MSIYRTALVVFFCLASSVSWSQEEQEVSDPFEAINRPIFAFNEGLDKYLLRPLAVGYDFIMPNFAQRGVTNFFDNLGDANGALNALLQGEVGGAARDTGRFLVNSTVGAFGLFDIATAMGIEEYDTDFGHTLASWGIPSGPYVMVPFFGPRTVRSGTGTVFDSYASLVYTVDHVPTKNSILATDFVEARAQLLDVDELVSGDRYIFIRDLYLQQRKIFVNGGVIEDSFSDFEEDDWGDDL